MLKFNVLIYIFGNRKSLKFLRVQSISKILINKIKDHLSNDPNILLLTHINPDGDAIGSILGLYHYLVNRGFKTYAVTPNNFPTFLQWLPCSDEIIRFSGKENRVEEIFRKADVIFNLDFNEPGRIGSMEDLLTGSDAKKILIDHHPNPKKFNQLEISDTSVSSTAELIYQLLTQLESKPFLTQEIATSLFTGIMTDTGCFSFNSSSGDTFRITSELLESGIDKDRIFEQVYNNFSEMRMKLAGFALNENMVVLSGLHTAYITLTREELLRFKHSMGDTEGFVNLPLSITGIQFSALFIEKEGHVKISFRSKGSFPANQFSEKHFNGGGHHNAAGGESFDSLSETIIKFEKLLKEYADQLSKP